MNPKEFTPLRDDVLLKLTPQHQATESLLWFKEDINNSDVQFFTIMTAGPEVKHVKVGDLIVASWKRITTPFALDSTKKEYGVTSEKEIMAVIDQ